MKLLTRALGVGHLAILAACVPADGDRTAPGTDELAATHRLPETRTWTMNSSETGVAYQISVALPYAFNPEQTYPVLYILDSNGMFGMATELVRYMRIDESIPEVLVVGIGWPLGRFWNVIPHRAPDLTPTMDDEWIEERGASQWPRPLGSGGADAFLRFLTTELRPVIEREFETDPTRQVFHGHSLGGLFGLHVLFSEPTAFSHYIISSPSLWWDGEMMFEEEERFAEEHERLDAHVFLSVGSLEHPQRMVDTHRRMTRRLEQRGHMDFTFESRVFEDEMHNSVVPLTITHGLKWHLGCIGDDSCSVLR